jgi:hypothetical protein
MQGLHGSVNYANVKEKKKMQGHREEQSIRKRFRVEKSMQGLQIRAEKSNLTEQNE